MLDRWMREGFWRTMATDAEGDGCAMVNLVRATQKHVSDGQNLTKKGRGGRGEYGKSYRAHYTKQVNFCQKISQNPRKKAFPVGLEFSRWKIAIFCHRQKLAIFCWLGGAEGK
jgi:hypothetical protein